MSLRGSPTPPGYRRETSKSTVKVSSTTNVTYGQVELDSVLANSVINLQTTVATKESEIAVLNSDLATANTSLSTANTNLATANDTILDLQDQLDNAPGAELQPYLTNLNGEEWTYFPGQTSGAGAQPEANFLDSYAYDTQNKIHSFTTKSIAVGNEAYAINTGAEFIGPKWYKLATYSDGSPVMIGDSFSFTVRMENVTKDVPMNGYLVALDLFEWPYKDDNFEKFKLNYQRPLGFCAVLAGGSKGFGTHVGNNTTIVNTSGNSLLIDAVGTVVTPGGARTSSRPSWTINWSSNYTVRNATTNTNYHTASSEVGQLYLGLLVSSNGGGATVGGTASMKISYSIGKLKS
jgi:hypothetical protein